MRDDDLHGRHKLPARNLHQFTMRAPCYCHRRRQAYMRSFRRINSDAAVMQMILSDRQVSYCYTRCAVLCHDVADIRQTML